MISVALINDVLDLEIFKASKNAILKHLILLKTMVALPLQKIETDLCQLFPSKSQCVCELSFALLAREQDCQSRNASSSGFSVKKS